MSRVGEGLDVRVISIGALAAHPLWNERGAIRTGHATTTLIRAGRRAMLVDPGLPAQALGARLHERSGLRPEQITDVFLTTFKPETMRGLGAFESADWWVYGAEREGVGVPLATELRRAHEEGETDLAAALERDVAVLQRCQAAPDKLLDRVDLFPLAGVSPGACGLLIPEAQTTTLICGDAVATVEHAERGQALPPCADLEQAKASLMEALEIADILIPGRDNVMINRTRWSL